MTRDQALASDQQAAGQILTDQANLETAKINLGYTEIASPSKARSAAPTSPRATWSAPTAAR